MPKNTAPAEGVSVLGKVSALLEVLAAREQATAAELADLLDEPRSSVHRMLRQLHELGWVEPAGARGQWSIGLHLFRLGSSAVQRMDVRRAAWPHMEDLAEATGETVFLIVPRGLRAVCIERIEGRQVQSIALVLGGSMPLHAGAGPMSVLAWSDEELHREWLVHAAEHGLERFNLPAPPGVKDVEDELRRIRERGYSISDRNITPGIAAIGAPVFDYRRRLIGALSVSGIAESVLNPELTLPERVMEAARRTSFDLGYRETGWPVPKHGRSNGISAV
ncbi:IclR family transcriptional regulator [Cryptosporangium arvum]|uniref:IclR family transcriptional regulator n=1 Tax=Cryptosporangium arvum TaxID=80871 RepID=UPI0004B519A7|nr:IclR family transcriptional regulator [Cryptosporangium arvum]